MKGRDLGPIEARMGNFSYRLQSFMLALSISATLVGCATTHFSKYKVLTQPMDKNGVTVKVGQIKDERGVHDPKAIRFNVSFDRPVAEVIREALILELQQAGYSIGPSDMLITATLASFSTDAPCSVVFSVNRASERKVVFSKAYEYTNKSGTIFDEEAHLEKVQKCVFQFVNDYQLRVALG